MIDNIEYLLSNEFISFFINPILEVDPHSESSKQQIDKLLNDILNNQINKAKTILEEESEKLLLIENKKKISDFLLFKCPKDSHLPKTTFQKILHHTCQLIIRNNDHLSSNFINNLNDISLEYYANHFNLYSIKIYQKKGSLKQLINQTEYILEKYTGTIQSRGAEYGGLGTEYHDIHTLEPIFRDELIVYIYFNLNNPEYLNHNNIYYVFWGSRGKNLWTDISGRTINKLVAFFREFLELPNLEVRNINISHYYSKTPLPSELVEVIESSHFIDTTLTYDYIIDRNFQFKENIYDEIRNEINGTYRKRYFTAMYVLIRKLLENLLIDCLRIYYEESNSEKFFDENNGRFLTFEVLKKNFNSMKDEPDFRKKVGVIEQKFIDVLDKFRDMGNIQSHSLFSLSHQTVVEENKDLLNLIVRRLNDIMIKLGS